jgi:hypothetical protein
MYLGSKFSRKKIFHNDKCQCFKRIKKKNRICYLDADSARDDGLVYCGMCSPMAVRYKKEAVVIRDFAKKHNLRVYVYDYAVYVDTQIAGWKIVQEGKNKKLHLYHENHFQIYRGLPAKNGKLVKEYHQQYAFSKTIMGFLEYIVDHDEWRDEQAQSYKRFPERTKSQRKKYKAAKNKAKADSVRRVLNLIEEMEKETPELFGQ